MDGLFNLKRKGYESKRRWLLYVTLTIDLTDDLNHWFSRGYFENNCLDTFVFADHIYLETFVVNQR